MRTASTIRSNSRARRAPSCIDGKARKGDRVVVEVGEPLIVTYVSIFLPSDRFCRTAHRPVRLSALVVHKWLIREAILAAPKPLSMLTTDTPEAQLFSIPRSAAIPPKLAP